MRSKKTIAFALLAIAAIGVISAVRCTFCNGTGFGNNGKSPFTCTFCAGKGWK